MDCEGIPAQQVEHSEQENNDIIRLATYGGYSTWLDDPQGRPADDHQALENKLCQLSFPLLF